MKRNRIHLGNRYGVKLVIPPEAIVNVAEERTEGMVHYFIDAAIQGNPVMWHRDLIRLAASCYLQGLNDGIEAEMRRLEGHGRR